MEPLGAFFQLRLYLLVVLVWRNHNLKEDPDQ